MPKNILHMLTNLSNPFSYHKKNFSRPVAKWSKGGLGGARGAEAPPSRFIAPLSKFLLAERGSGKSCSSVSLDNLCQTAMVEEGAHRSSSSCKKAR